MPIGVQSYERSILPETYGRRSTRPASRWSITCWRTCGSSQPHARDLFIASYLPPRYLRRYDHRFLRRFLVCAVTVGVKLRAPGCTRSAARPRNWRCARCGSWRSRSWRWTAFGRGLRRLGDGRAGGHRLRAAVRRAPRRRGGAELAQARLAGYAHLSFRDWFRPFDPPRVVHPYVADGVERPWETDREHYDPDGVTPCWSSWGKPGPTGGRGWSPADLALARLGLRHTPQDYLSSLENASGQQLIFFWSHLTREALLFPARGRRGHPVHDGEAPELLLDEHERARLAACWSASARKRQEAIDRSPG